MQASVAPTLSDGASHRRHKFATATPEQDGWIDVRRGLPCKYIWGEVRKRFVDSRKCYVEKLPQIYYKRGDWLLNIEISNLHKYAVGNFKRFARNLSRIC